MRKFLKISAIVIASLFLLLVVSAVLLPFLIDANQFKPRIENAARDASGRELEIEGDISLSVFPWLGVELGRTTMGQPEGFEGEAFAGIDAVKIGVRLLPLLRKELDIDRIEIVEPRIHLVRKADGSTNWDDFAKDEDGPRADSGQDADTESADDPLMINVAGFELSGGSVEFVDHAANREVRLGSLSIETGPLGMPVDTRISFSADIAVDQSGEPQFATPVMFDGRITADPDTRHFAVSDVVLELEMTVAALQEPLSLSLQISRAAADLSSGTGTVEQAVVEFAEARLEARADITGLMDEPAVVGNLSIDELSPRKMMEALGIEQPVTSDDTVFSRAGLQAEFTASGEEAVIENIQVMLDDSNLSGRIEVADFESQAVHFDFVLDAIDIDRYLPLVVSDEETEEPAGDINAIEIPVEAFRGHNLVGKLEVGRLKAFNFRAEHLVVGIDARNDEVRLSPVQADFYDGGYRGDIRIDAAGDAPRYFMENRLETVQLAPLLQDVLDASQISGQAGMEIDLTASGATVGDIRETLGGKFDARVLDGTLEGFNLWEAIRKANAAIKGREYKPKDTAERTKFTELLATGSIDAGVVKNEMLDMRLPFLRVDGSGDIDIADETLDYRVTAKVVTDTELESGMEDLSGLAIPVRLTGPLADPKVRLELDKVLEERARAKASERLEEEKDKAKKKLEDKLKDIF